MFVYANLPSKFQLKSNVFHQNIILFYFLMGNNCITITSKTNHEVECMRGIYAPNYKMLVVHVSCIHQYSEKGPKIESLKFQLIRMEILNVHVHVL